MLRIDKKRQVKKPLKQQLAVKLTRKRKKRNQKKDADDDDDDYDEESEVEPEELEEDENENESNHEEEDNDDDYDDGLKETFKIKLRKNISNQNIVNSNSKQKNLDEQELEAVNKINNEDDDENSSSSDDRNSCIEVINTSKANETMLKNNCSLNLKKDNVFVLDESYNLNLLPENEIIYLKNLTCSPMIFATKVLFKIYKLDELHSHNVSGKTFNKYDRPKQALEYTRLMYIKWLVEKYFKITNKKSDNVWKRCCKAINRTIRKSEKKSEEAKGEITETTQKKIVNNNKKKLTTPTTTNNNNNGNHLEHQSVTIINKKDDHFDLNTILSTNTMIN